MPEFARLGEEAILRWDELTNEEMKFYSIILLHSLPNERGIRILTLTRNFGLEEICRLHGLNYDNTMRRFARMRTGILEGKHQPKQVDKMQSPWLKWDRRNNLIYPLVGVKTVPEGANEFEPKKTVNITAKNTVDITANSLKKTVKNTVFDCSNYSENTEFTVNSTASSSLYTEYTEVNQKTHTEETGVGDKKGAGSIFTLEECLQYAKAQKGVRIPQALAISLFRSGEADELISTFLLIESQKVSVDRKLEDGLEIILQAIAIGEDINNYRKYFEEKEWEWLMDRVKEISETV